MKLDFNLQTLLPQLRQKAFFRFYKNINIRIAIEIMPFSEWKTWAQNIGFAVFAAVAFGSLCGGVVALTHIFEPTELLYFAVFLFAAYLIIQKFNNKKDGRTK